MTSVLGHTTHVLRRSHDKCARSHDKCARSHDKHARSHDKCARSHAHRYLLGGSGMMSLLTCVHTEAYRSCRVVWAEHGTTRGILNKLGRHL